MPAKPRTATATPAPAKETGPDLRPRPSSLPRVALCPGSSRAEGVLPNSETEFTRHGRAMHHAMTLLLQVGAKARTKIENNPDIEAKDIKAIESAWKWGTSLLPDDDTRKVICEDEVPLDFLGSKPGHPDAIFLSPKHGGAVVIDWKFGVLPVPDPDVNFQLLAYAIGVAAKYKAIVTSSVELAIIQPNAIREDDRVRSKVFTITELRQQAERIKEIVAAGSTPDAQRVAGRTQCLMCRAKESCSPYAVWKKEQADIKEGMENTAIATVQNGGVEVQPDEPLSMPVVVINPETMVLVEEKKALALSMKVVDAATANAAGVLSKDMRSLSSLIDKGRKKMTDPIYRFFKKAVAAAEPAITSLEEGVRHLDQQVNAFQRAELEKAEAARKEEERKRHEAEERERQARALAAQKEQEAEEARQRAAEAERRAGELKSKAAREKAEREAAEARKQAEAADAERKRQEQAQADAQRQQAQAEAAQAAVKAPEKVTGYRQADVASWTIPSFAVIPKELLEVVLVANTKVIDQMIKSKALTAEKHGAWINITWSNESVRSR